MSDLLRDAPLGQLIRYVTKNKFLKYPEERDDWQCPSSYEKEEKKQDTSTNESGTDGEAKEAALTPEDTTRHSSEDAADAASLEKYETQYEPIEGPGATKTRTMDTQMSRVASRVALQQSQTFADLEAAITMSALDKGPTRPIEPERTSDGAILVGWYDTDDQLDPQNWSFRKKMFVTFQICIYTTSVYMGSSIYAPSELGVAAEFNVSTLAASVGLTTYVLAYGLGPMLWSPLSEIPSIGRNPPYIITFFLFVILTIPTALVKNFAGLLVLRFLQGFFGSPCLATGGASLQDMFSLIKVPYVLCLWAFAATCGPALGPMISGFSVPVEGWRWSIWEILWLAGPVWVLLFGFLPETYGPNLLLRRAQRLRQRTGNVNMKSQSEIDLANMKVGKVILENLWRPIQIMILDPAVLFTAVYTALAYGIYYSFFEGFPLVYIEIYGFNVGEEGLAFLSITVGVLTAIAIFWSYLYFYSEPRMKKHGLGTPEERLLPALPASFCLPIGLFWFAWTSDKDIHWIVPTLAIVLFTIGIMIIMQCIFIYLGFSYPQYAASLFAGNDFTRSTLAAGAIIFSNPLYGNLGIGVGTSILGALTAGCVIGIFLLWKYGAWLRARSRFAVK